MKIGSISNNNIVSQTGTRYVGSDQATDYSPQVQDTTTPVLQKTDTLQKTKEAQSEDKPDEQEILQKAVEQANKSLKLYDRQLEMSVHEVTHTIMYKLVDTNTKEIIMEFPPKKIQDMIAKMWELAGLFVDKKA